MPERVSGLVLAAGGSRRLGRPKQTLPYRGATLLDAVLDVARACPFDELLVALGGSVDEVREQTDLSGARIVVNPAHGSGCSSSIAVALGALDPRSDVLVLLLGDQPGVRPESVRALLDGRGGAPLAACRYDDGRGHPLAFDRTTFPALAALRGDKAVWRLLDERADELVEVRVAGPVPRDVDTWADYEALRA